MYVERSLERQFDKAAELYSIVAVVGARQSGKTTLLKKKLQEKDGGYVSLDDPDARELFNEDIKKFEKQYLEAGRITGIDEVQYGREAGIKLKYLADKGYRLWVTSSSETLLGKDVLSYLVGRVSILRLYPFSLPEFQRARKTESLTEKIKERLVWEHVNYGGYPKVVLAEDFESKKILLKDLMDTMLLKDVSRTFAIEDVSLLERLVKYLSINTGNIVSYENITTYLGVSFQTLKKYLDAMEKSYIITRTLPYHTNKLKELSKKPKIYFIDTGLRNSIIKSYATDVEGKIFENYVLTELLKNGLQVKYWRTKSKAEVDFIVEKDSTLIPVEVKTRACKAGRGIKSFIKTYKPEKTFVVHYNGIEKTEAFEGCAITFTDTFGLLKKIT